MTEIGSGIDFVTLFRLLGKGWHVARRGVQFSVISVNFQPLKTKPVNPASVFLSSYFRYVSLGLQVKAEACTSEIGYLYPSCELLGREEQSANF